MYLVMYSMQMCALPAMQAVARTALYLPVCNLPGKSGTGNILLNFSETHERCSVDCVTLELWERCVCVCVGSCSCAYMYLCVCMCVCACACVCECRCTCSTDIRPGADDRRYFIHYTDAQVKYLYRFEQKCFISYGDANECIFSLNILLCTCSTSYVSRLLWCSLPNNRYQHTTHDNAPGLSRAPSAAHLAVWSTDDRAC